MEKKKVNLSSIASEAGKNARDFLGRTKESIIKAVDQNDDNSLDMKDVSALAEIVGNAAKNAAAIVKSSAEEKSLEHEKKLLQPIFLEDLDSADFALTKLIRVTEIDKRRAESEVCKGSIGYIDEQKDLKIVTIFSNRIDAFGLSFFPDTDSGLYYVDPTDRDKYIALDDYFAFLKMARINELQKIAQDLGAKHFRVTYKEQKTNLVSNKAKGKATYKNIGVNINADYEKGASSHISTSAEIAAEMDCPGHAPVEPKLQYLQRDPSIQSLIALRLDPTSPTTHQVLTLKFSTSSGIKEKDAVKIDAALKSMKLSGNTTVASEVQNEARRIFEYEVDF